MDRGERRDIKERKWLSRLRKLWNSHVFWYRISEVKKPWTVNGPEADSFIDFKRDKFGVLIKNTGTMFTDNKRLLIKEERKRNINNRLLRKEDVDDIITWEIKQHETEREWLERHAVEA